MPHTYTPCGCVACLFDYSYVYASNSPLKHEPYFLVNALKRQIATLQQRINAHPRKFSFFLLCHLVVITDMCTCEVATLLPLHIWIIKAFLTIFHISYLHLYLYSKNGLVIRGKFNSQIHMLLIVICEYVYHVSVCVCVYMQKMQISFSSL